MTPKTTRLFAAAALAVAGLIAGPALGQTATANGGDGTGLNALSDDALLIELAGRNMQGLLDHAFDANKVPEQQRLAMLALPAIRRLGDPNNPPQAPRAGPAHQPDRRRRRPRHRHDRRPRRADGAGRRADQVRHRAGRQPDGVLGRDAQGAEPAAAGRRDGHQDARQGRQDRRRRSGRSWRSRSSDGRNEALERQWTEVDELVTTAEYTRAMVTYNKAMAMPGNVRGIEQRKKEVDAGDRVPPGLRQHRAAACRRRSATAWPS